METKRADLADYIADLAGQLAKQARLQGLSTVAFYLEMASAKAQEEVFRHEAKIESGDDDLVIPQRGQLNM